MGYREDVTPPYGYYQISFPAHKVMQDASHYGWEAWQGAEIVMRVAYKSMITTYFPNSFFLR
jgi:hypothetical protein